MKFKGYRRVAVTGMGAISALGSSLPIYTDALYSGINGCRHLHRKNPENYRSDLGALAWSYSPNSYFNEFECRRMDRATQLAVSACNEAMTQAGLCEFIPGNSHSCVMGTTLGGMNSGIKFYKRYLQFESFRYSPLLEFPPYVVNNHIMKRWKLTGSSQILSSACAASTHAIGTAFDMIRTGQSSLVITGGFDTFSELTVSGFGVLGLLAKDAVRPFDPQRSGLVLGEGAGILILEEGPLRPLSITWTGC